MRIFDNVYVYGRFLEISIRGQMQYRLSFVMLSLAHLLTTAVEFLAVIVLFDRFGSLTDWELGEVAFMYGIVNIAFSVSDAATRGFDVFGTMVKAGDFDRLLTRPRSTVLQLAGQELTLRRVGRFLQGLVIMIWAANEMNLDWSALDVGLVVFAVLGGAALFAGLIVIQATISFWSTESLEVMNSLTYGGVFATSYPVAIYRSWFRDLFIYIVPLASVSYFPTLAITGRSDPLGSSVLFQYLSPLIGFAFFAVTLQFWRFGVRHYRSTGS
ncbi:MAG: ABC-2 family transporter protein [Dehalococcoidia bacterium]|nr:ABC-2 family transporter protein [Dehalococcoidia bacterium]